MIMYRDNTVCNANPEQVKTMVAAGWTTEPPVTNPAADPAPAKPAQRPAVKPAPR